MLNMSDTFNTTVTHSLNAPYRPPTSTIAADQHRTEWYYCRPGFNRKKHLKGGLGHYYFETEKEAVVWALLNHVNLNMADRKQNGHVDHDLATYDDCYIEASNSHPVEGGSARDTSDDDSQQEDEGKDQGEHYMHQHNLLLL
jgi:hypothetical protein